MFSQNPCALHLVGAVVPQPGCLHHAVHGDIAAVCLSGSGTADKVRRQCFQTYAGLRSPDGAKRRSESTVPFLQ